MAGDDRSCRFGGNIPDTRLVPDHPDPFHPGQLRFDLLRAELTREHVAYLRGTSIGSKSHVARSDCHPVGVVLEADTRPARHEEQRVITVTVRGDEPAGRT